MDTVKVGKFIAGLRRERGLTQQQFGEIVGATNKTVSRWETGNYLPPVEVLEIISREFGVTINEIVAGERLGDSEFRRAAEKNLSAALSEPGAFGLKERMAFFKKKWLRDHMAEMIVDLILYILAAAAFFVFLRDLLPLWLPLAAIALYLITYNRMMSYVERKSFGGKSGTNVAQKSGK